MKKTVLGYVLLGVALLATTSCDTALTVGSKTIGVRSGEFIYTDGYLRTTYPFPLETLWQACDKALSDLKATEVDREKSIATGKFTAYVQDDKVQIAVSYVERDITAVSVKVGLMGNTLASQLIHDRIAARLTKP